MWNNVLIRCILAFSALGFGCMAAAGVFTVLISVGLIPRFAGKTHTATHVKLYEDMVIMGTIIGCIYSATDCPFPTLSSWTSQLLLILYGLFTGIFVGCLAISIAEMLNSIPIFARRIGFRNGMTYAIFSVGLGKLFGSLLYFYCHIYITGFNFP